MKMSPLATKNPHVRLIEPDVERDAPQSVTWLEGDIGRDTLRLMGVSVADNKPSTLAQEKERVASFLTDEKHLNWMISFDDTIVGSVWVDLHSTNELPAPGVHIMIGDPNVRGKGIGKASVGAVIEYLHQSGEKMIYSRHLLSNYGSQKLLESLGFVKLDEPYTDKDNLSFQNVVIEIRSTSNAGEKD